MPTNVVLLAKYDDHTEMPVYLLKRNSGDTVLAVMDPKCFAFGKQDTTRLNFGVGEFGPVHLRTLRKSDSLSVEYSLDYSKGHVTAMILFNAHDSLRKGYVGNFGGYSRLIPLDEGEPAGVYIIQCDDR